MYGPNTLSLRSSLGRSIIVLTMAVLLTSTGLQGLASTGDGGSSAPGTLAWSTADHCHPLEDPTCLPHILPCEGPLSVLHDRDGDCVPDERDNCPDTWNPDQADSDGDGIGDACEDHKDCEPTDRDWDGDCIPNEQDNCPEIYNPDQRDRDGDGIGDACDENPEPCDPEHREPTPGDRDGDCVPDGEDNCPDTWNPDQADRDGDGVGDACDVIIVEPPCDRSYQDPWAVFGGDLGLHGPDLWEPLHPLLQPVTRDPCFVASGYDAAGTGLRGAGADDITLSAVPSGSTVLAAYLYWQVQADNEAPTFKEVELDGTPVTGSLIGSGSGLCWGVAHTYAYRVDVTSLVGGAGTYHISQVDSGSSVLAQGASLVVVYDQGLSSPTRKEVRILEDYHSVAPSSSSVTFPATSAPGTVTELTVIGGDGQSHSHAGERTDVNGVTIATDSWDGSDPQTSPFWSYGNLWDTDTFDVSAAYTPGSPTTVEVHSDGDCVGPTAYVLSVSL